MRIAIIYKENNIFAEFPAEVFKEMLMTYMEIEKNSKTAEKLETALEKIVKDLKKLTITK